MGTTYTQLSITERRRIERWRHAKVPVDEMARVLRRCRSTIFRELKRNLTAAKTEKSIYYLPGRSGEISKGLGYGLLDRGFSVTGRETRGAFLKLSFQQQIDAIHSDLENDFWHEDAKLVAVSYGCYLFLHAQLKMAAFPGRVLLLSPVLGGAFASKVGVGFFPPRANTLSEAVDADEFPQLQKAEIHVGSEDWQSNPEAVRAFGKAVSIPVTIVEEKGHMLGVDYVGPLLDRWLGNAT